MDFRSSVFGVADDQIRLLLRYNCEICQRIAAESLLLALYLGKLILRVARAMRVAQPPALSQALGMEILRGTMLRKLGVGSQW